MDQTTETMIAKLANRFKEPSSWAGIGALTVLLGVHLDPSTTQSIMYLGAGAAGIIAFFLPEKKT